MPIDAHEQNRLSWNAATERHNLHKGDQAKFFRDGGTTGERLFTNNRTDAATSFQVNVGGEGLVVAVHCRLGLQRCR